MKPTSPAWCIVVVISVLSGCAPQPKKARYTVDQYLVDRELMNRKVEECANNPGELEDDPDCVNAIAAARRGAHKTLRELYGQPRPANSSPSLPATPGGQ
jgi:hypothetical protein